jgi:hypothetical protein
MLALSAQGFANTTLVDVKIVRQLLVAGARLQSLGAANSRFDGGRRCHALDARAITFAPKHPFIDDLDDLGGFDRIAHDESQSEQTFTRLGDRHHGFHRKENGARFSTRAASVDS